MKKKITQGLGIGIIILQTYGGVSDKFDLHLSYFLQVSSHFVDIGWGIHFIITSSKLKDSGLGIYLSSTASAWQTGGHEFNSQFQEKKFKDF